MNIIENNVPYSFKSATVERHQLNVESHMKDLFKLSKKERLGILEALDFFRNSLWLRKLMIFEQIYRQILKAYINIWLKNLAIKMPKMAILTTKWGFERSLLNEKYAQIEKSESPAGGYRVIFSMLSPEKRVFEIFLEAIGERIKTEKMEMPEPKGDECAFCKNTQSMQGYEKASTKLAHVIQSLEKNPLAISNDHFPHFFDMPIGNQDKLLRTAIKVIDNYKTTENKVCNRYMIIFQAGSEGGQTFPHTHGHIYACMGSKN